MDSRKLFFLLLSLILTLNLAATKIKVGVLPVGVIGNAPFVIENNKNLTGISIALWERLADLENLNYSFVYFKSMPDAIDAASKGDVKALIGPISITKTRAEKVSFSQPYFRSGLGIAVRNTSPGLFEKFMPFLKTGLLVIFLSILPLLFLVGLFIWLSERNKL